MTPPEPRGWRAAGTGCGGADGDTSQQRLISSWLCGALSSCLFCGALSSCLFCGALSSGLCGALSSCLFCGALSSCLFCGALSSGLCGALSSCLFCGALSSGLCGALLQRPARAAHHPGHEIVRRRADLLGEVHECVEDLLAPLFAEVG